MAAMAGPRTYLFMILILPVASTDVVKRSVHRVDDGLNRFCRQVISRLACGGKSVVKRSPRPHNRRRHAGCLRVHQESVAVSGVRYLLRRLVLALFVMLGALTVTFAISHVIPGDPARLYLGARASDEAIAAVRADLGLDDPLPVQFVRFVSNAVQGEFGYSYRTKRPSRRGPGRTPACHHGTRGACHLPGHRCRCSRPASLRRRASPPASTA